MTLVSTLAPAYRGARRNSAALFAGFAAAIVAVSPAAAQKAEPGAYAVARTGVQIDSDVKPTQVLAKGQTVAKTTPTLPKNIDHDGGFTGELGMGYDFGGLRVEGTAGYDTAKVNAKALSTKTYSGAGRTKSFDLGVAAYVDLVREGPLKPFVGGGIGASRVDYSISRLMIDKTPGTQKPMVGIMGKDWGFRWHLDAGASYDVTPQTAIEVLGRYSQTTGLRMKGTAIDENLVRQTMDYKLKNTSVSIMAGIRQKF
ncbi:outer membrane beta-barrel protein [Sphingomonas sp. gentR]|jgi:opacity protein-like surface antigen|uniref:outer membrane protein n=1 Tax=unclassified Sphingomonas TaxID=196159 RepID=UPI0009728D96|nr:outer membrane beta-barrel protein [Sphingomonas sp. LK11]APX64734.1 hypothetical protein AV944_01460 [Sphingomonas sp. LK11]